MATATKKQPIKGKTQNKSENSFFVFKKQNYILLIASLAVIIIGFIVMGSGEGQPFDAPIKITVAPIIVMIGFILGAVSILYTPKQSENSSNNPE
jgi:ABC-type multidrug transport system fused ATPase/permease subunit